MDKANRKAIIAGNWKMNKTATEAVELIDALIYEYQAIQSRYRYYQRKARAQGLRAIL